MLKHCHATAADATRRSRRSLQVSDSASLNSSTSSSSSSSSSSTTSGSHTFNSSFLTNDSLLMAMHGNMAESESCRRSSYSSPEPTSLISRTSSFASLSLNESDASASPKVPIKIFAKCLRPDIEYKTLCATSKTTSRELIWQLLSKVKMRHKDPNLFYLTMDITIKRTGIPLQRTLVLEDDAHPAELKSCHPWGDCRFSLQMRRGGLVRIHDSVLMSASKYKALLIAEHTSVQEVIQILFHCYGLERIERVEDFAVYEQCQSQCYERRLHPADRPAQVQSLWPNPSQFMFVLRRESASSARSTASVNSAGVSPVSSEVDSTMSDSPVPSEASYGFQYVSGHHLHQPHSLPSVLPLGSLRKTPPLASIHESGLPEPPPLRPKPVSSALLQGQSQLEAILAAARTSRASSVASSGSGSSVTVAFHDYENYFYI